MNAHDSTSARRTARTGASLAALALLAVGALSACQQPTATDEHADAGNGPSSSATRPSGTSTPGGTSTAPTSPTATSTPSAPGATSTAPSPTDPTPSATASTGGPTGTPSGAPSTGTSPGTPTGTPTPEAGPVLLTPGDAGPQVADLHARLVQLDWLPLPFDDAWGAATTEAIKGFQAKRGFVVTGTLDTRTWERIKEMSRPPTPDELEGKVPPIPSSNTQVPGPLDPRCQTGSVLCIDKSSNTLRWVKDGHVQVTLDARFGGEGTPTREGVFSVFTKSRDHVSSLFDTSMPFAMFFDGGQAVHYSPDFAAKGYSGASHGCVNIRDRAAIESLYDQIEIGTKVVVYRS